MDKTENSPLPLSFPIPVQDGTNIGDEPQSVQDGKKVQQRRVGRIAEPGLDRNRVI